ncbi:MAG: hypothetical protein HKP41_07525 [Desulfobacterales bacterium]|nr:hypothetical protein [Deltaproteobacteria bacterium]NNK94186.1 hypothetical protein [Desulfobacterales bacterium]
MYTNNPRMASKTQVIIFLALAVLVSSCSAFNETPLESYLGKDVNLVDYSYDIADDLITEAFPPLVTRHNETAVLTTTFVDNNDLKSTSHFGRLLQDHIGSRFVQKGYAVNEIKLGKRITINQQSGETILSRDLSQIKPSQKAQAVLVGTVSQAQRTMYISARLINPANAKIISSKNYRLYMDRNVLAMFNSKIDDGSQVIQQPSEPLMNSILY